MNALRIDIDGYLKTALDRHLEKTDGKTPKNLSDSIRYSLLGPGKRIRPRLLLACAEMLKLKDEAAIPAAATLEMLHCFTLVHDDLPCMDDDDIRRGRPSNHKQFGEAVALLAGDALLALSMEVFLDATPHVEPARFLKGLSRLLWCMGPRGVTGGQAAELLMNSKSNLEDLIQLHSQKTGSLFSASLLIPMDFAGVTEDSAQGLALELFAKELGIAFQVSNDLEDATDEPVLPTNVLFYVDRISAQSNTLRRLETAMRSLSSSWNAGASRLLQIAEEVVKKLETH